MELAIKEAAVFIYESIQGKLRNKDYNQRLMIENKLHNLNEL